MEIVGSIRRIDDLGRVAIPKDLRRNMRIREGDPLELHINSDGELVIKKYSELDNMKNLA